MSGYGYGYGHAPAATQTYSKAAEWYLVFCMFIPIFEGKFNDAIDLMVSTRSLIIFRLTPYNLVPTELFFCGIGFFIGMIIWLTGRRPENPPVRGVYSLFVYCVVIAVWVVYGFLQGRSSWLTDARSFLVPVAVVPWVATLAHRIRVDVVYARLIRLGAVLAVLNAIGGALFFVRAGFVPEGSWLAASFRGEYVLLFCYLMAFARTIGSSKKTPLSLIALAMGLLMPLHKPVLFAFMIANVALVVLALKTGRRFGNVKIGGTLLTIVLLGGVGLVGVGGALSLGRGFGKEYLLNRIFKYNQSMRDRDVSGGRIGMWTECLERWVDNPIIGRGMGDRLTIKKTKGIAILPIHNLYIQLLMQMGIVGLLPIIAVAVIWLTRSLGTLSWETSLERYWPRLGAAAYILTILAGSSVGDVLAIKCIAILSWMVVAIESVAYSRVMWENNR
ncbi:MAG: hypothetical protein H6817_01435 [Phycisphaerales bacterium]|nr:hypothetical protein [Phycisphaerales bacterium]